MLILRAWKAARHSWASPCWCQHHTTLSSPSWLLPTHPQSASLAGACCRAPWQDCPSRSLGWPVWAFAGHPSKAWLAAWCIAEERGRRQQVRSSQEAAAKKSRSKAGKPGERARQALRQPVKQLRGSTIAAPGWGLSHPMTMLWVATWSGGTRDSFASYKLALKRLRSPVLGCVARRRHSFSESNESLIWKLYFWIFFNVLQQHLFVIRWIVEKQMQQD